MKLKLKVSVFMYYIVKIQGGVEICAFLLYCEGMGRNGWGLI
jgi:hypothetical protein